MDSRKFSTSDFRWICMLWDVLGTKPFFRKCLSICTCVGLSACMSPKFCGYCISRTYARILIKLYTQLHLDIIWSWLDFWCITLKKFRCRSKLFISGIKQNCVNLYQYGFFYANSFEFQKNVFVISIAISYIIFVCWGNSPSLGGWE